MTRKLVIFGAWYFSDVVGELATALGWNVVGRVDPEPPDTVETLESIPDDAWCFVAIGDNTTRQYVSRRLESGSRRIVTLAHGTASVSPSAVVGAGSFIGEYGVVRTGSVLGRGAVVGAGAVISHHCQVGDFSLLGPNAALGSRSQVGERCLVGVGACVHPGCAIGADCTVGAGSAVVRALENGTTVIGNPARTAISGDAQRQKKQSDWSYNTLW